VNDYLKRTRQFLRLRGESDDRKTMVRALLAGEAKGINSLSHVIAGDNPDEEISREDMMSALEDDRVKRDVTRAIEITKRRGR
jgi:hypothetical protein